MYNEKEEDGRSALKGGSSMKEKVEEEGVQL